MTSKKDLKQYFFQKTCPLSLAEDRGMTGESTSGFNSVIYQRNLSNLLHLLRSTQK